MSHIWSTWTAAFSLLIPKLSSSSAVLSSLRRIPLIGGRESFKALSFDSIDRSLLSLNIPNSQMVTSVLFSRSIMVKFVASEMQLKPLLSNDVSSWISLTTESRDSSDIHFDSRALYAVSLSGTSLVPTIGGSWRSCVLFTGLVNLTGTAAGTIEFIPATVSD